MSQQPKEPKADISQGIGSLIEFYLEVRRYWPDAIIEVSMATAPHPYGQWFIDITLASGSQTRFFWFDEHWNRLSKE